MKKSKRILAVAMSLLMLISCFTVLSSAISYESAINTGTLKVSVAADKTTVNPGDTVTFSVLVDPADRVDFSAFQYVILFPKGNITPVGTTPQTFRTWNGNCTSFANPAAGGNMNFPINQISAFLTAEELAYYTGAIMILGSGTSSAARWTPIKTEPIMTFQMKVSDSAKAGDEILVGLHDSAFEKKISKFAINSVNITDNTQYNLTESMVKLTVGSPAPTYAVEKAKSQVSFTGTKPTPDDKFTYRLTSKISAADLTAMNSNGNTITGLGFIAANADVTTVAEAKAAVEAGSTLPTGWKNAKTDYISQANGTADAFFGCRIQNISHASQDKDITCVAYVAYNDGATTHYVWYAAPVNAAVSTNYDAAVASWAKLA